MHFFEGDEIVGDDDAQKRKMREERFTLEASQTSVTFEYELKKQQRAKRFGLEQGIASASTKASSTTSAHPGSTAILNTVTDSKGGVDANSKLCAVGPTGPKASNELSEPEKRKL